jgi:hypothetical protein
MFYLMFWPKISANACSDGRCMLDEGNILRTNGVTAISHYTASPITPPAGSRMAFQLRCFSPFDKKICIRGILRAHSDEICPERPSGELLISRNRNNSQSHCDLGPQSCLRRRHLAFRSFGRATVRIRESMELHSESVCDMFKPDVGRDKRR